MASSADTSIEQASVTRDVDPKEKEDTSEDGLLDKIDKLTLAMLPPQLQSVDLEELKRIYHNATSISVLITGKTGSGKSTLINGILGIKAGDSGSAPEGSGIKEGCTTEVTSYRARKGKIDVTVWNSPGLQDGTKNQKEYLRQMKEKCSNRDLTIYCLKISDTRFVRGDENPAVVAMKKLTKVFGKEFWSNTVIVLTFANTLEAFHWNWKKLSPQEKAQEFTRVIQQWETQIREILSKDIKVAENIVESIRIVPAGHYEEPHLPGYSFWLSALWFHCVGTIPTPEAQAALVRMTAQRFKMEKDVTKNDLKKTPEQQPIIVDKIKSMQGAQNAINGAIIGGLISLSDGLIVPVPVPVGMGIGAGVVGLMVCTYYAYKKIYYQTEKNI